jgi:hypothetical protein
MATHSEKQLQQQHPIATMLLASQGMCVDNGQPRLTAAAHWCCQQQQQGCQQLWVAVASKEL